MSQYEHEYMSVIDNAIGDKPIISESLFISFIPFFFEEMGDAERKAKLEEWLVYAVDGRVPVIVAKDDQLEAAQAGDAEARLFEVPPIINGPDLERNSNLVSMLHYWALTMNQSALHGRAWARENLTPDITVSKMPEAVKEQWRAIRARYKTGVTIGDSKVDDLLVDDDEW